MIFYGDSNGARYCIWARRYYSSKGHWILKQHIPILRNKFLVSCLNLIKDSREIQIILVGSAWRGGKGVWRSQTASKTRTGSKRGKMRGPAFRGTASKRRARAKRRTGPRRTVWSIKSPSRVEKSAWRATTKGFAIDAFEYGS